MIVYGIIDGNGKLIQSSFQFNGTYGFLIFQTKKDAKAFRDTDKKCFWKGVYQDCDIKKFKLIFTNTVKN